MHDIPTTGSPALPHVSPYVPPSLDGDAEPETDAQGTAEANAQTGTETAPDIMAGVTGETLALGEFIRDFGAGMLDQVKTQTPPVYQSLLDRDTPAWRARDRMMRALKRQPFAAQAEAAQAIVKLLVDHDQPAAVLNAEMGTGKVRRIGA